MTMRIELGLLAAAVIAGLGLVLFSGGSSEQRRGGTVIDPSPPTTTVAPAAEGLFSIEWPGITAAPVVKGPSSIDSSAPPPVAPRLEVPLDENAAGVWATPAEFAPVD